MEEDIQNYLPTVIFRGIPCIILSVTIIDILYNNVGSENTFGTETGISVGIFSQVCFGT